MRKLQWIREARGWSRAELARRAKLNQVTVGTIELGRFTPYPGQLQKLARALQVPLREAHTLLQDVTGDAGGRGQEGLGAPEPAVR
jgi:transcriptional regulator with XRE-family HTH domain